MKKAILLTLFISVVLYAECVFGAMWQEVTDGITDKEFYSIAEDTDSEIIYIGTSDGLYKKDRDERDWGRIFICRGQYRGINHIFVAGDNTVYIATKNGLYQSSDFGRTWKRLFRGIGEENHLTYVISYQKNKEIIYLGTNKGLFWTENKGKTWKKMRGILGNSRINSIAIGELSDDTYLFVICNNEVYKIASNSKDYKKIFGSDSVENFDDNSQDEEETSENETIFFLNNISLKKSIFYLSTNRGIFTSDDNGRSWQRFNDAGLSNRWINDVVVSGSDSRIFASTRNGVFEYKEKERLWSRIHHGMDSIDVRKLMLTDRGDLWALCKTSVYRAELGDSRVPDKNSTKAEEILSNFKNEPTINETMDMAIDYAEVHPDKIKKWRRGAKLKALLPKVSFGIDQSKSDTYEIYTSSSTTYWVYGPEDATEGWDIDFSWDLSDLIWNESQTSIDVRSKLMVQLRDDIVDEVTRTYFERRRLQIELLMDPPDILPTLLDKRLRIQELTASLDGLTGGRFSKAVEQE